MLVGTDRAKSMKIRNDADVGMERSAPIEKWAKILVILLVLSLIPLLIGLALLLRGHLMDTQQLVLQQSLQLRRLESRCGMAPAAASVTQSRLRRSTASERER